MSVTNATPSTQTPAAATPAAATSATTQSAQATPGAQGESKATESKPTMEATPAASVLGDLTDPKPVDKQAEGEQATKEGDKPNDAAALEIKLPEGVSLDAAVLAEYQAELKGVPGMTSEIASQVVALDLKRQAKEVESFQQQGEAWGKELASDKEFGGDNFAANAMAAKRALRKFGGEALAGELKKLGIGNFPPLVKAFAEIGKALKEDDSTGGGPKADAPSEADKLKDLYPSMFPGA
jgi:hypothetical protein